jgi:hypothetical protein
VTHPPGSNERYDLGHSNQPLRVPVGRPRDDPHRYRGLWVAAWVTEAGYVDGPRAGALTRLGVC